MTEQADVHDSVQTTGAQQPNASGEDAGLTVDRTRSNALTDAKRYRKRAQAAEKQVEELQATLAEREQKLANAAKSLAQFERRQQIDHALVEAGAMDIDMARQLAEAAMAQTPDSDIHAAIDELQRSRPFLFRQNNASIGSGVMSAAADDSSSPRDARLHRAASNALETGKRSDLLRYLRLRRRGT